MTKAPPPARRGRSRGRSSRDTPLGGLALGAVKKAIVLLAVGLGCAVPVACSTSSSGTAGGKDASTDGADGADAHIINDPQNCIPPGTPNNAAGVGGYCSPGG